MPEPRPDDAATDAVYELAEYAQATAARLAEAEAEITRWDKYADALAVAEAERYEARARLAEAEALLRRTRDDVGVDPPLRADAAAFLAAGDPDA